MNKICTSLEQSKKLIELGIDVYTADMYWKNGISDKYIQFFNPFVCGDYQDGLDFDYDVPAWSLTALLSILPRPMLHQTNDGNWYCDITANRTYFSKHYDNPVDACVEMVLKLHELNLL